MSGPQIIRTPSGEELVVLPRAEYEALIEHAGHDAEDADDVAIYDARKAELAAGGSCLRRWFGSDLYDNCRSQTGRRSRSTHQPSAAALQPLAQPPPRGRAAGRGLDRTSVAQRIRFAGRHVRAGYCAFRNETPEAYASGIGKSPSLSIVRRSPLQSSSPAGD